MHSFLRLLRMHRVYILLIFLCLPSFSYAMITPPICTTPALVCHLTSDSLLFYWMYLTFYALFLPFPFEYAAYDLCRLEESLILGYTVCLCKFHQFYQSQLLSETKDSTLFGGASNVVTQVFAFWFLDFMKCQKLRSLNHLVYPASIFSTTKLTVTC